jgi:hypothetical protein
LASRIIAHPENEKPYLNPKFSIDSIVLDSEMPKQLVQYG